MFPAAGRAVSQNVRNHRQKLGVNLGVILRANNQPNGRFASWQLAQWSFRVLTVNPLAALHFNSRLSRNFAF